MIIRRFEDVKSWQEAKRLTIEIYQLTNKKAFSRDYSLRDQIRRASVSIMANIAEGFGRKGHKDFIRFINIANGSALEVQSHLHIARELGYISSKEFNACYKQAHSVSRLIGGFINYLSKQLYTETPDTNSPETR